MTTLQKRPSILDHNGGLVKFFDEGAYGVVFFDDCGNATKVFKKDPCKSLEHVQLVFQSEIAAYEIATNDPDLREFVPSFYGAISCEKVLDICGNDISGEFHLNFAYRMQRINGVFRKELFRGTQLEAAFRKAGILHTSDASVVTEGGQIKYVIDFATKEYELQG